MTIEKAFEVLEKNGFMEENSSGIQLSSFAKLTRLKGYPKGVDLENWELEDSVCISRDEDKTEQSVIFGIWAGGDWQEMTYMNIVVPENKKPYIIPFDSLETVAHGDVMKIKEFEKKKKEYLKDKEKKEESFEMQGRKCKWLKESGKPAMLSLDGKNWAQYDNLKALQKAERKETFESITVPVDLDVDSIFELLAFVGPTGLAIAKKKIKSFEKDLFKTATPKIDSDLRVAIWSSFPGLPDNSVRVIKDKITFSNTESILEAYLNEPEKAQKVIACLNLAPSFEPGKMWKACVMFGEGEVSKSLDSAQFLDYSVPENSAIFNQIENGATLGLCFYEVKYPTGESQLNLDISSMNLPDTVCYFCTALMNGTTDLSDIQLYLTSFDTLCKQLSENKNYKAICENGAFRRFVQDYCDESLQEINAEQFYASLVTFIESEQSNLSSTAFAKAFRLILDDESVKTWKDSLAKLDELCGSSDVFVSMITAHNVLVNIKSKLWHLFQTQSSLREAKNNKIAVKDTKGRVSCLVQR